MKKALDRLSAAVFAVALAFASTGCISIWNALFPPEEQIEDQETINYIFDEPRARHGVVLSIGLTANGYVVQQTADFRVDQDGNIFMPHIGAVKVDGLTLQDIKTKLYELYADGYYKNPQVSVDFHYTPGASESPWGTVVIQGQVGRPGPVDIPRTRDLRLTRALQLAGGVTGVGDSDDIQVSFIAQDGKITRRSFSLTRIGKGYLNEDIILPPGSTIYVPYLNY